MLLLLPVAAIAVTKNNVKNHFKILMTICLTLSSWAYLFAGSAGGLLGIGPVLMCFTLGENVGIGGFLGGNSTGG